MKIEIIQESLIDLRFIVGQGDLDLPVEIISRWNKIMFDYAALQETLAHFQTKQGGDNNGK